MNHPRIIQGGMGIAVSAWPLASAVAQLGGLGVVSGAGIDIIFFRHLQDGDPGGHLRRALARFPDPDLVRAVLGRHFIEGGRPEGRPYGRLPLYTTAPDPELYRLGVLGAFAEVTLAKEGHGGSVGMNLLEKMQMPTLPALYGALLAGVDYILMGAGIPLGIAGNLDQLSRHQETELKLYVEGAGPGDRFISRFDPKSILPNPPPELPRPFFFPIVASVTLADMLMRKSTGRVDGFIVEGPTAGGHNAPPRGPLQLTNKGEPLYGVRDEVDPAAMRKLGLPFWLAGSYAHPDRLKQAMAQGAAGIQVGTAFAFCRESGLTGEIKAQVLRKSRNREVEIFTDPYASPTGFPFKVVQLEGSVSDPVVYAVRRRVCDLGYLRQAYRKDDGTVGLRCPAEPVDSFVKRGGKPEDAEGRKCLCNALLANVGLGQRREDGTEESPLVTAGDEVVDVARFLPPGEDSYSAADVMRYLLG